MWFQSSGFSCALSSGSVHSCGCVVLFRPSLSLVNSWGDDDGRYLQCEFVFCGKSFHVCCIYAPNRNPARDQFFDDLQSKVDPSVPTILCGDFNAVFDQSVDQFGSNPSDQSRESSTSLQNLFDACCTVDIWRYLHPSSSRFSWTRWDGTCASRIDLCGERESDGSIVSSLADLCRSLSSFYLGLFTASSTDPCAQSALLGNLSSFLPDDQAALCEGHLSVKEVSTALLGMARRKAPG